MNFFATQQNVNFNQFSPWSAPSGCWGTPSGPSQLPSYGFPSSPFCPPGIAGGQTLANVSSFWNQVMQAQQSLFQGWQHFCGCHQQSAPQWGGQCQTPQPPQGQCQPQEVHVHHHYHYHPAPQTPAPPQSGPVPRPRPLPAPPQAGPLPNPTPTPTPYQPPVVTIPQVPTIPSPLPRPPVQNTPALPSFGGSGAATGVRHWGSQPSNQVPPNLSIEDIFNNPFQGQEYLKDALDTISAIRNVYGVQPNNTVGQKGDLRVIAGDRYDGVKPREIRVDDANNYDWQKGENSYQENRQEFRFKDGTIGREYDILVTWEDGTQTRKRVQLKEAGQIVYIRTAEGY